MWLDWGIIIIFMVLTVLVLNYLAIVAWSRLSEDVGEVGEAGEAGKTQKDIEGFADGGAADADTADADDATKSRYEWLRGKDIYDDFYAKIYPKITQFHKILQGEIAVIMAEWRNNPQTDPKTMTILDVGCGTGVAAATMVKMGAGRIIGLDESPAMIRYARDKTLPSTTLSDSEKELIEFRNINAYSPSALNGAEVSHIYMTYFSIYYFHDMTTLFRNLAFWCRPGGKLALEVVDKYRFEAIPDSSNPWVGINPQRYKKERITKGTVEFDRFTYKTEFNLYDPRAEFNETFRFKDGTVRRHKHELYMYDIQKIVEMAAEAGWKFDKSADLMPFGFPHAFILFFTRTSGHLPALETQ